jgi:NAD(P)-dependent dehydrogenase (short-subunit alcohol dehydrogenase family)
VELVQLDVRDEDSVRSRVNAVVNRAGRIDALVNSAGYVLVGALEETSIEEARRIFETNFFGTLRMCQAVLPIMREQKYGRIANVSSVLGFLPAPYMGLYAASKYAIEGSSHVAPAHHVDLALLIRRRVGTETEDELLQATFHTN